MHEDGSIWQQKRNRRGAQTCIGVNLSSTPLPQPLSHAGERGARESDSPSPMQQKRSIRCPPPSS
ncbi:hypothetical protein MC7420_5898 [Coleofasciculus chthonoplastes PCC 7420]|uniref:Uncharacterized protein n=1 Tax=Coleofasciculus chthonoplastes PCC 7420 TaxID=118168 RepID=B4VVJ0_9CYAN|nr:hypothetical protein MC7420_5898 [Coleofasciculus chthonoplastes PCC 7420]